MYTLKLETPWLTLFLDEPILRRKLRRMLRKYFMASLLLTSTVSCVDGRVRSLVDDLRFVAASAEPPALEPGERVTLHFEVADPGQQSPRTLDYLFLPCSTTVLSADCLESVSFASDPTLVNEDGTLTEQGYRTYLETYLEQGTLQAGLVSFEVQTSPMLGFLLQSSGGTAPDGTELPTLDYLDGRASLLVCAEGSCDALLDDVKAVLEGAPANHSAQELVQGLGTGSLLEELPMELTARASKGYRMAIQEPYLSNLNPRIGALEIRNRTVDDATDETGPRGSPLAGAAEPGVAYSLSLTLDPAILQTYDIEAEAGSLESFTELVSLHWFSTVDTSPQEVRLEDLSEPVEATLTLPVTALEQPFTLWISLTDDRLGSAWRTETLTLGPTVP